MVSRSEKHEEMVMSNEEGEVAYEKTIVSPTSWIPMRLTNRLNAWLIESGNRGSPVVRMETALFSVTL